jgi:hypothetical protein
MKNIRPRFVPIKFIAIFAIVACVYAATGYTQRVAKPRQAPPLTTAPEAGLMERVSTRQPAPEPAEQMNVSAAEDEVPGPNLVTATSYPFTATTGVALEDMSTGTTQLVAASQDDTASAVTNLGFDYWYDGVRFTQFSVNANGLMRLGATAVSTIRCRA